MNIELSKNNHMVVGYNGMPWTHRTSLYDRFFINYSQPAEKIYTFNEASVIAAKEISKSAELKNKKPLILYSGGIDSEFIIASFIKAEVDFSVAHVRYLPNYNDHETDFVYKFCKRYNLDLKEFYVNADEFFRNEKNFDSAIKDNARLIELQLITEISEKIKDNFFPISDHPGVMLFRKNTNLRESSEWYWKDYEHLCSYYFHCMRNKIDSSSSFFHWSPEIILAFLVDPLIVKLVSNNIHGKITIRTSTLPLYRNTFPEFNFEDRPKFRGFEYMSKTLINNLNNRLNSKTYYDRHSGQTYSYNELCKILMPK